MNASFLKAALLSLVLAGAGAVALPVRAQERSSGRGKPVYRPPKCARKHWPPYDQEDKTQAPPWTLIREGNAYPVGGAKEGVVVVRDMSAWLALWAPFSPDKRIDPDPEPVDFERDNLITVFAGEQPNAGYSLRATLSPGADPAEVVVSYEVVPPPPDAIVGQVITNPFQTWRVPKRYTRVRYSRRKAQGGSAPAGNPAASRPQKPSAVPAHAQALRLVLAAGGEALRDAPKAFDNAGGLGALAMASSALPPPPGGNLPPPPGDDGGGKPLPPPPGGSKPLPPPPGGGKPLPPPPGGGKPLPPPPRNGYPDPLYPGGPLPPWDSRLILASRVYSTYGLSYIGYWNGPSYNEEGRGEVRTAASDGRTSYTVSIDSRKYEEFKRFYYDPGADTVHWMPDPVAVGGLTKVVILDFVNRAAKPLLPWERERFVLSYKGDRAVDGGVRLESADGAYQYSVSYLPALGNAMRLEMDAQAKLKTAPDPEGVSALIASDGAGLKLALNDRWASYYAGETLEIALLVKKKEAWYKPDSTAYEATTRSPLRVAIPAGASSPYQVDVPLFGSLSSGTYYVKDWSFRRAAGAVSSDSWQGKGKGNTVQK